jgi:hypothetical protein
MMSVDPYFSDYDGREHDFNGAVEPALLIGGTLSTPAVLPVNLSLIAEADFLKYSSTDASFEYDGLYSTLNLGLIFYPVKFMASGAGTCYRYMGGAMSSSDIVSADYSNVGRWRPYVMTEFQSSDHRYKTRVNLDLTDARWKARNISVKISISYRIIPDWIHRSF